MALTINKGILEFIRNSEYDKENSEEIYELYDGAPHLHSHHNCQIHGYVDNTDFLDNTTNENDSEVQLKPIKYFRQVADNYYT